MLDFDLNGKASELATAREIVKSIESHLSSARENMIEAIQAITSALQE
jgi:hypothetical protein